MYISSQLAMNHPFIIRTLVASVFGSLSYSDLSNGQVQEIQVRL